MAPQIDWEWGEVSGLELAKGRIPNQTEAAGYGDPRWQGPDISVGSEQI